jgi:Tfp pilus assembly protein PilF
MFKQAFGQDPAAVVATVQGASDCRAAPTQPRSPQPHLEHRGRYAQAGKLMRRALDISSAVLPADDPDLAGILANLGSAHLMQRHDAQAELFFTRALAVLERSAAEHQWDAAAVLCNLGVLRAGRREWDTAEQFFLRSVATYERTLGPAHPELVKPLVNLGRVNLMRNRPALAEDPLRRATELTAAFGSSHPLLREALVTYALALQKLGKKSQNREVAARAKALGASSADLTVHISDLIRCPLLARPSDQWPSASRNRSASIAAMHPAPEAVIA